VGDSAPDFELKDIRSGEKVKLSGLKGQVVVLHMWKNN
jgi:peroxiredoxin